jgi:DNA phosphorothioation-dependent restriction protein DptG
MKRRLNTPDSKGLLLIFNQGNPLHNRPKDFRLLLVSVLRKRKPNKERKFPHIHGLEYFSYETVKTERENMSFWAPVQIQSEPNEDVTQMKGFQKELQQGWYSLVQSKLRQDPQAARWRVISMIYLRWSQRLQEA